MSATKSNTCCFNLGDKPSAQEIKPFKRTKRHEKFLKKPNEKNAKNLFFTELVKTMIEHPNSPPGAETKLYTFKNNLTSDFETCGKILKAADVSKQLDLYVLDFLINQVVHSRVNVDIERFLESAHFDFPEGVLKVIIALALKNEQINWMSATGAERTVLFMFLNFVNSSMSSNRQRKIWKKTKGFEIVSQPSVLLPLFFNHEQGPNVSVYALSFLTQISAKMEFLTPEFVFKYICRMRTLLDFYKRSEQYQPRALIHLSFIKPIQQISKIILESEQSNFFQKLASSLPEDEQAQLLPSNEWENNPELFQEFRELFPDKAALPTQFKPSNLVMQRERAWEKMKCSQCQKKEQSEREFQKCSGCHLVYYCSRACQKSNWKVHKKTCKKQRN